MDKSLKIILIVLAILVVVGIVAGIISSIVMSSSNRMTSSDSSSSSTDDLISNTTVGSTFKELPSDEITGYCTTEHGKTICNYSKGNCIENGVPIDCNTRQPLKQK